MFILTVYIPSGSIYEQISALGSKGRKIAGISHFLEHLLFKDTEQFTGKELLEAFTQMGGYYNASTDKDETIFYVRTMTENYQLATDVIYDIVCKPVFRQEDLDTERKIVLEELAQTKDNLDDYIYEESTRALLAKDNIYMPPVIGKRSNLKSITLCDVKSYYHERFQDIMIVVNCDESLKGHAEKYIASRFTTKGKRSYVNFEEKNKLMPLSQKFEKTNTINVVDNGTFQYNSVVVFPSYRYGQAQDNLVLNFLRFCLTGAGLFSILYYEIREKLGLVYSIKLSTERNRYLGLTRLTFATSNKNIVGILKVVFDILTGLKMNGLDTKTLKYFKTSCLNHYKYKFTSEEYRASWYGDNLFYGTLMTEDDMFTAIRNITNDDLKRVASDVFNLSKAAIYTIGSYGENANAKKVKKELVSLVASYSVKHDDAC
jgi:predicted Zn-dependent peptidase